MFPFVFVRVYSVSCSTWPSLVRQSLVRPSLVPYFSPVGSGYEHLAHEALFIDSIHICCRGTADHQSKYTKNNPNLTFTDHHPTRHFPFTSYSLFFLALASFLNSSNPKALLIKISNTVLHAKVLKTHAPKAKYPFQIHPLLLAPSTALTTCLAYSEAGIALVLLYP